MLATMKTIWRAWKGLAHRIISVQNWVLMAWVYIFAVAPVAIFMKLFGQKLVKRPVIDPEADSYWQDKPDGPLTMDRAQRMF
jgi:hypothetical protein